MIVRVRPFSFTIGLLVVLGIAAMSSRAQAQTSRLDEQGFPVSSGEWNTTQVITVLYGSSSRWVNPPKAVLDSLAADNGVAISTLFAKGFSENGEKKYYLVTNAVPVGVEWNCISCGTVTGVFEFVERNNEWLFVASDWNMEPVGGSQFGQPPAVELVQIGPGRYGLKFSVRYQARGSNKNDACCDSSTQPFRPWIAC